MKIVPFGKMLAAVLAPMQAPKAPKGQVSVPAIRDQVQPRESAVQRKDRLLATSDRLTARTLQDTRQTVLELSKSSPDMASAVSFMQRVGIPEGYVVVARDMDGTINPNATALAQELLRRMTFLGNADGSFQPGLGIQSLSEQLAMELQLYGAMCLEVALDKARVPSKMIPVSVTKIIIYDEEGSFKLAQKVGGDEIDLDIPTIIYVAVDQLQTEAYASSYLESALQPILADIDFNNDMRRVLKRAVIPRIQAVIDSEKVRKLCPPEIMMDAEKFAQYKNGLIDEISNVLNGMNPEDAIVTYDSVTYSYLDSEQDPSAIIERIQSVLNAKLASGAKTLPVILGHGDASNASSTQATLYLKQADMIRRKLNELYSRALTIAVRIMGEDCFVDFKYDALDLRPKGELEAYKSMEQSRILMQLSLGFLTDEEACVMLTGNLPPKGMKPLSGTLFMSAGAAQNAGANANPDSTTSALKQKTQPSTPTEPKSQQGS